MEHENILIEQFNGNEALQGHSQASDLLDMSNLSIHRNKEVGGQGNSVGSAQRKSEESDAKIQFGKQLNYYSMIIYPSKTSQISISAVDISQANSFFLGLANLSNLDYLVGIVDQYFQEFIREDILSNNMHSQSELLTQSSILIALYSLINITPELNYSQLSMLSSAFELHIVNQVSNKSGKTNQAQSKVSLNGRLITSKFYSKNQFLHSHFPLEVLELVKLYAKILFLMYLKNEKSSTQNITSLIDSFSGITFRSCLLSLVYFSEIFDFFLNFRNTHSTYITSSQLIYNPMICLKNLKEEGMFSIYSYLTQVFSNASQLGFEVITDITSLKYICLEVIVKCIEFDEDQPQNFFESKHVVPQINIPNDSGNRRAKDKSIDLESTLYLIEDIFRIYELSVKLVESKDDEYTNNSEGNITLWQALRKYCCIKLFLMNRNTKTRLLELVTGNLLNIISCTRSYIQRNFCQVKLDEEASKSESEEEEENEADDNQINDNDEEQPTDKEMDNSKLLESIQVNLVKLSKERPKMGKDKGILSSSIEFEAFCQVIYSLKINFTQSEINMCSSQFIPTLEEFLIEILNPHIIENTIEGAMLLIDYLQIIYPYFNVYRTKSDRKHQFVSHRLISERKARIKMITSLFMSMCFSYFEKVNDGESFNDILFHELTNTYLSLACHPSELYLEGVILEYENLQKEYLSYLNPLNGDYTVDSKFRRRRLCCVRNKLRFVCSVIPQMLEHNFNMHHSTKMVEATHELLLRDGRQHQDEAVSSVKSKASTIHESNKMQSKQIFRESYLKIYNLMINFYNNHQTLEKFYGSDGYSYLHESNLIIVDCLLKVSHENIYDFCTSLQTDPESMSNSMNIDYNVVETVNSLLVQLLGINLTILQYATKKDPTFNNDYTIEVMRNISNFVASILQLIMLPSNTQYYLKLKSMHSACIEHFYKEVAFTANPLLEVNVPFHSCFISTLLQMMISEEHQIENFILNAFSIFKNNHQQSLLISMQGLCIFAISLDVYSRQHSNLNLKMFDNLILEALSSIVYSTSPKQYKVALSSLISSLINFSIKGHVSYKALVFIIYLNLSGDSIMGVEGLSAFYMTGASNDLIDNEHLAIYLSTTFSCQDFDIFMLSNSICELSNILEKPIQFNVDKAIHIIFNVCMNLLSVFLSHNSNHYQILSSLALCLSLKRFYMSIPKNHLQLILNTLSNIIASFPVREYSALNQSNPTADSSNQISHYEMQSYLNEMTYKYFNYIECTIEKISNFLLENQFFYQTCYCQEIEYSIIVYLLKRIDWLLDSQTEIQYKLCLRLFRNNMLIGLELLFHQSNRAFIEGINSESICTRLESIRLEVSREGKCSSQSVKDHQIESNFKVWSMKIGEARTNPDLYQKIRQGLISYFIDLTVEEGC